PLPRANRRVLGEQIEEPHEQLGALRDVSHGVGLERMDEPDRRRHQRERPGRGDEARRAGERSPDDAEQDQRREDVQREIEGMIAAHVQLAERVVDRQSEARYRPASEDGPRRRSERTRERPKLPAAGDGQYRGPSVEDEWPRQAVRPRRLGQLPQYPRADAA